MAIDGVLYGTHVLIAGGTGIFPYLDFAFYIIRYMINKISKNKFNEKKNKIDNKEIFNNVQDDFKLLIFASYTNIKSAIMDDILKKANNLDIKYKLNMFDYNVRAYGDKYWDSTFFTEK